MSVMTQRADILVVDDDPGMLETLGDVLAREGHRVHAANRGSAALSRLIQSPPVDLAIVDFKLPDISGIELLSSVKASSPETEVILITGYGSLATALEAIEGQVASYLVKPLNVGHLLKTVEQALARQRLARALRESEERYRLVTDALTEAVLLLNPTGHVVLANRYAETLTAYGQAELRDLPIAQLDPYAGGGYGAARLRGARGVPPSMLSSSASTGRGLGSRLIYRVTKRSRSWYLTCPYISDARGDAGPPAMARRTRLLAPCFGTPPPTASSPPGEFFQGRRAVLYEIDPPPSSSWRPAARAMPRAGSAGGCRPVSGSRGGPWRKTGR